MPDMLVGPNMGTVASVIKETASKTLWLEAVHGLNFTIFDSEAFIQS
jgi:hypothetical protein